MLPYRDSRVIRIVLILFFILLIAYALFEARGLLYGPVIMVPESAITVHDEYTIIKGTAAHITELHLNGKTISVTESGEFEEPFLLARGTNHLILEASDARGRRAQKVLDIVYVPSNESSKKTAPSTPEKSSSPSPQM